MGSLRDTKDRIVSVKKTKKITQAMKMVAAAKFKRAQRNLDHSKDYGNALRDTLADMATRLEPDNLPALFQSNPGGKEAFIVISADRGLCGGFNSSILKHSYTALEKESSNEKELFIIGNKAAQFFKSRPFSIAEKNTHITEEITPKTIEKILGNLVERFEAGEYSKVRLFYNKFVSAIANTQEDEQLLPLKLKDWTPTKRLQAGDYIYNPGKAAVLANFGKEYVIYQVYEAFLNSNASEEGSRMAAMDSATSNATDVIYDLSLEYNRSRQAAITTEISEIVAGATSS